MKYCSQTDYITLAATWI